MTPKIADLIERVSWTFLQAIAGTIAAAGAASQLNTFDWRAALIGGVTAAAIAASKVLLGQALNAGAQPAVADMAREVLLDVIDELFPKAAPEVAAFRAATATAAQPATAVQPAVQTAPAAPPPVVTVTTSSAPAPLPLFTATTSAPTPAPAAPAPAPAPEPAPEPVNAAAALAALSAQQPTR